MSSYGLSRNAKSFDDKGETDGPKDSGYRGLRGARASAGDADRQGAGSGSSHFPGPARDEDQDPNVAELDRVLVTGSRIPRSQLETASPVITITCRGHPEAGLPQRLRRAARAAAGDRRGAGQPVRRQLHCQRDHHQPARPVAQLHPDPDGWTAAGRLPAAVQRAKQLHRPDQHPDGDGRAHRHPARQPVLDLRFGGDRRRGQHHPQEAHRRHAARRARRRLFRRRRRQQAPAAHRRQGLGQPGPHLWPAVQPAGSDLHAAARFHRHHRRQPQSRPALRLPHLHHPQRLHQRVRRSGRPVATTWRPIFGGTTIRDFRPGRGFFCGSRAQPGYATLLNEEERRFRATSIPTYRSATTPISTPACCTGRTRRRTIPDRASGCRTTTPAPVAISGTRPSRPWRRYQHIFSPEEQGITNYTTKSNSYNLALGVNGTIGDTQLGLRRLLQPLRLSR